MKDGSIKWIILIFVLTFVLSSCFSGIATLISDINVALLIVILMIVIAIGILADMVGVAVLTGNEATFHAKASRKINGAKECVSLLRSSAKVSSICNDVIGDICGILSGALGTTLSFYIAMAGMPLAIAAILTAAVISTVTVGGKAICKKIAIKECDSIVFLMGRVSSFFKFKKEK